MKELPTELKSRLMDIYGEDDYEKIIRGFDTERMTSFRVNTLKSEETEIEGFLEVNSIPFKKIAVLPLSYLIEKKHEYFLKGSDIYYSGKIYVQGIASQIPPIILEAERGDVILDMTAAPGSKTTQIAALIDNDGEIVACEKNQIRFDKLMYNVNLQGATCIRGIKSDALEIRKSFSPGYFDKILLDAPCSAEGRIRLGDEKTFGFWSIDNIKKKQELQMNLLEEAVYLLKKGGTIIYSTCTLAPEEDEEVIDTILRKHNELHLESIEQSLPSTRPGIISFNGKEYSEELKKTLRIDPTDISEGFYIAKLKKI